MGNITKLYDYLTLFGDVLIWVHWLMDNTAVTHMPLYHRAELRQTRENDSSLFLYPDQTIIQ